MTAVGCTAPYFGVNGLCRGLLGISDETQPVCTVECTATIGRL